MLLLLFACAPDTGTVQPLVDARAGQIALDASLACRLALGTAAVVAEVAPRSAQWWVNAEGDQLPLDPQVEDLLDLRAGEVRLDTLTAASSAHWLDVEFSPDVHGDVVLDVLRPRSSYLVTFQQHEEPELQVRVRVTVQDATADPILQLELDAEVSESPHQVRMPLPDERTIWPEGGGLMPLEGGFSWGQEHPAGARSLSTVSVDQVDGLIWPVVVEAEDWAQRVDMDLARAQ
jgi:hypothetical protein